MAQLAGKSKGYVPAMGSSRRDGRPGRRDECWPGGSDAADSTRTASCRRKRCRPPSAYFKKWDKDGNGTLDEKEIEAGINSLVPSPQFGPPGGPQRGRPPGGQP
jgi:hypothetical protein